MNDDVNSYIYETDGYRVTFKIIDSWEDGYNYVVNIYKMKML